MINAALALAAKPNSKVAQDNMDLFKEQWEKQVRVLTDAVDDITSIDDFLCVSGECYSFACHSHTETKEMFHADGMITNDLQFLTEWCTCKQRFWSVLRQICTKHFRPFLRGR